MQSIHQDTIYQKLKIIYRFYDSMYSINVFIKNGYMTTYILKS